MRIVNNAGFKFLAAEHEDGSPTATARLSPVSPRPRARPDSRRKVGSSSPASVPRCATPAPASDPPPSRVIPAVPVHRHYTAYVRLSPEASPPTRPGGNSRDSGLGSVTVRSAATPKCTTLFNVNFEGATVHGVPDQRLCQPDHGQRRAATQKLSNVGF
jgi:hypothetical protein